MPALFWLLVVLGVAFATPGFAHAALLKTAPAERAVLALAPAEAVLTFNEPVSVILARLIDAAGQTHELQGWRVEGGAVRVGLPERLPHGTLVLSYRVMSIDGHPIGGSLIFSVGAESGVTPAAAAPPGDVAAGAGLWLARLGFLAGLFLGVGGVFFARVFADERAATTLRPWLLPVLAVGAAAGLALIGLQGLDVLGVGLAGLLDGQSWAAGLASPFGRTALVGEAALGLAVAGLAAPRAAVARPLAVAGFLGTGLALSLSGHAASAPPQAVTATAVVLHALGVAFWIGALAPLALLLARRGEGATAALARFSQAIPFALVPLIGSGAILALVQLVSLSDLWTTAYGGILAAKLVAVAALLGLAARNRYALTRGVLAGDAGARRRLVRTVAAEVALAGLVLALVTSWRFTPPPRNLFAPPPAASGAPGAAPPAFVHVMNERIMVDVAFSAGRAGAMSVAIGVNDPLLAPVEVKAVTLRLANPGAGIEAFGTEATAGEPGKWRIDSLLIPLAGRWEVTVEVLVNDFETVSMTTPIDIAR